MYLEFKVKSGVEDIVFLICIIVWIVRFVK